MKYGTLEDGRPVDIYQDPDFALQLDEEDFEFDDAYSSYDGDPNFYWRMFG